MLTLLEAVAQAEKPVTVGDLNADRSLPTPTAYRLCSMLEAEGFLQRQMDGRRYIPGPRFYRVAWGVITNMSFRARRRAILESVAAEIGETCNIAVPDGNEMVYIDRVESHWPLQIRLPVGSRVPAHCSASGKLYLSMLSDERRKGLLSAMKLERLTKFTITDPEALERELEKIRQDELGTEREEFAEGMFSIAVPIKGPKGRLHATLSVHAPIWRLDPDEAMRKVPVLRRAAAELSSLI